MRWSYRPPVQFQVMVGLAMAGVFALALYLKMLAARELFRLMSWTGYLVTAGILLLVAFGLAAALGVTSKMYHRWGAHELVRRGDQLAYTTNLGRTVSWPRDRADVLIRLNEEPWTGVIVAGDGLVQRVPATDGEAETLLRKIAELHR